MSMIKVNPLALAAKLAAVIAVVPKKTLKESLMGVRCYRSTAEQTTGIPGGNMGFSATDLELGIQVGPVSGDWCLVEGAKLLECLRSFSEPEIDWNETEDGLLLSGPAGEFLLPYLPKGDHPDPITPQGKPVARVGVSGAHFVAAVESVEHAVAKESARLVMTGILIRLDGGALEITGCDGRRMASCCVLIESGITKKQGTFAVPRAAFRALAAAVDKDSIISISFGSNDVIFEGKDYTIQSRLIEGRMPDISALWPDPKEASTRIQTSRQALIDALKRVTIMIDPNMRRANVAWSEKVVIGTQRDNGGTAQSFVDAAFSGSKCTGSYNPGYLSEWLRAAKSDEVILTLQGPDRPLVMSAPVEESGANLRGIIMPMT